MEVSWDFIICITRYVKNLPKNIPIIQGDFYNLRYVLRCVLCVHKCIYVYRWWLQENVRKLNKLSGVFSCRLLSKSVGKYKCREPPFVFLYQERRQMMKKIKYFCCFSIFLENLTVLDMKGANSSILIGHSRRGEVIPFEIDKTRAEDSAKKIYYILRKGLKSFLYNINRYRG